MKGATLSSKFQIVIPKEVREELGLRPGQRFVIVPDGKLLHLVPETNLEELKGSLAGADLSDYRDRSDLDE